MKKLILSLTVVFAFSASASTDLVKNSDSVKSNDSITQHLTTGNSNGSSR